jgi:hypothetical protein
MRISRRLEAHAAACATGALAVLGGVAETSADVVYSGVVNLPIQSTIDGLYLNVVTGQWNEAGGGGATVPGWDVNPYSATGLSWFAPAATTTGGFVRGLGSSTTLIDNLAPDTPIDGTQLFGNGASETAGATAFALNSDANIAGFRFVNEANGQVHYGWMRISLSSTLAGQPRLCVEYAYESNPGVGILAGATSGGGGGGCEFETCGSGGPCDTPGATPGCADSLCCCAVCEIDDFCCNFEWDVTCVELASTLPICGGGGGGNPACAPGAGDCCVANGSPGCDEPVCCNLICGADPFCCDTEWDGLCAGAAATECKQCAPEPLACGDADAGDCCVGGSSLLEIDVSGIESFAGAGSPLNTVLEILAQPNIQVTGIGWSVTIEALGGSWLSEAAIAFGNSAEPFVNLTPGAGNNGSGIGTFDSGGIVDLVDLGLQFDLLADGILRLEFFETFVDFPDAPDAIWVEGTITVQLSANATPACNDLECCELVCAIDSFCCEVIWDEECAAMAVEKCAVCVPPACGDADAGDCCEGPETGESTVDLVNVESYDAAGDPSNVVLTVNVGGPTNVVEVSWDVLIEALGGSWLSEAAVNIGNSAEYFVALTPGAGVNNNGGNVPTPFTGSVNLAGQGLAFPVLEDGIVRLEFFETFVDVQDAVDAIWNGTLVLGTSTGVATPFCNDAECCEAVCALDPLCCETEWDADCVKLANEICSICGSGPSPCPWDLNGDGQVGGADLGILLQNWGNPYGGADLGGMLQTWGPCPN